ncbi:MAG: BlaI/MecI/CopY family transcriptional regulator [Christensenellaceae bacterium]
MEFTKNELQIMSLLWSENRPMTKTEILALSLDKTWKDNSFHIIMNSLISSGAVAIAGFEQTGKRIGRTYVAEYTFEQHLARQVKSVVKERKTNIGKIVAALYHDVEIDSKTIQELEKIVENMRMELKEK